MRQIKFKGKRKDGVWVFGDFFDTRHSEFCNYMPTIIENGGANPSDFHLVDPDTVSQFTGLTDKNGREIYEGDIVTISEEDRNQASNYKEWKGIVVWSDNDIYSAGFRLVLYIDKQAYGNRPLCQKTNDKSAFIIIGNIHDNLNKKTSKYENRI